MSSRGQMGATDLLAQLLASLSQRSDPAGEGIGAGEFVAAQSGVSCEIHLPSGDRYVVVVQWIGDRESDEASSA